MRATVKDVAALAGVSPKTVSNVINGVVFVRPETRERVEQALAELDYVPNLSARGLRNGRSGMIALALPDLATPYSSEMAHHFVEAAHARDWGVQLEESGARPERELELLSRARERVVDGLVLNPIVSDDLALAAAHAQSPVVLIGEVEQDRFDQVRVDPVLPARELTAGLIASGHRRIAVVGSPLGSLQATTARSRTAGYRMALTDAARPHDAALEVACDDWSPRGGAAAIDAFLERHALPDAIFCFTDSLAIGVLSALWRRGIRVPDDVVVAGYDDVADGEFASPPLTTVSWDKRAFADAALDLLRDRIADPALAPRLVTMPHRIVVRASTRR